MLKSAHWSECNSNFRAATLIESILKNTKRRGAKSVLMAAHNWNTGKEVGNNVCSFANEFSVKEMLSLFVIVAYFCLILQAIDILKTCECICEEFFLTCNGTCGIVHPTSENLVKYFKILHSRAEVVVKKRKQNGEKKLRKKEGGMTEKTNLIYLVPSPDYCDVVKGRKCDGYSESAEGCEIMCCGKDFSKQVIVQCCNCQFIWCCRVKCDECFVEVNKCN